MVLMKVERIVMDVATNCANRGAADSGFELNWGKNLGLLTYVELYYEILEAAWVFGLFWKMEAEDDHGQWYCAIADAAEAEKAETGEQKVTEAAKFDAFAAQIFHLMQRLYL